MRTKVLTDAQVEREIEKLKNSPLVKLAKKEERIRNKRRQYLSMLKWYEKKGRELKNQGYTMENLDAMERECDGVEK